MTNRAEITNKARKYAPFKAFYDMFRLVLQAGKGARTFQLVGGCRPQAPGTDERKSARPFSRRWRLLYLRCGN